MNLLTASLFAERERLLLKRRTAEGLLALALQSKPTGGESSYGFCFVIQSATRTWNTFFCTGISELHYTTVQAHPGEARQLDLLLHLSELKPKQMLEVLQDNGVAINYRRPEKELLARNVKKNLLGYLAREERWQIARGIAVGFQRKLCSPPAYSSKTYHYFNNLLRRQSRDRSRRSIVILATTVHFVINSTQILNLTRQRIN
jgi:hypothetical protein